MKHLTTMASLEPQETATGKSSKPLTFQQARDIDAVTERLKSRRGHTGSPGSVTHRGLRGLVPHASGPDGQPCEWAVLFLPAGRPRSVPGEVFREVKHCA